MSVSGRLAHRLQAWGRFDEAVVETLFHDMPDAVIYGSRDRHILGANQAALRMFGYEREEFQGLATSVLYASERDYRRQGEESFNPRRLSGRTRTIVQYMRRDRSLFWGETTAAPVANAEGEILGYLSITRNVTEQLATERALKRLYIISADQSRDSDRKIADIMELGRSFYAMESAVIGEARGGCYIVRKVIPENCSHPRVGERFPLEQTQCSRTLKAGGPFAFSERSEVNGSDAIGSYIGAPVRVDGAVFGTLAFFSARPRQPFRSGDLDFARIFAQWVGHELAARDARARLLASREEARRLQKLSEQESFAKTRLIASLSPAFRQPMARIGAALDLLVGADLPAFQRAALARLRQDCSEMAASLSDLCRLAEPEKPVMPVELDDVLVRELFDMLGSDKSAALLEALERGFERAQAEISAACAGSSSDGCRRAAHFLKGQALNAGASGLADLAGGIEEAAAAGALDPAWPAAVAASCARALEALRAGMAAHFPQA